MSFTLTDDSMKSFDMTDSIISGLCSKSSRPEDSDTFRTDKKSDNTETSSKNESSTTVDTSKSFNNKESTNSFTLSFESIDNKSKNVTKKLKNRTKQSEKSDRSDRSNRSHCMNLLSSRADPLVYDRKEKIIRYNFERCVSTDSKVVFGGNNGNFIFNPKDKTLTIGFNNKLENCVNSSTINCENVNLKNCKETVAVGIKRNEDDDEFFEDLNETLLVRNLYVAGNLSATNIKQNSAYVVSDNHIDKYYQVIRGDGIDIIYANPVNGTIWVQLGIPSDTGFEANRKIVIKDVSLESGQSSPYNINIIVPPTEVGSIQTRIEYYNGKLLALSSDKLSGYVLNTVGGSVTYRYVESFMPGQPNTWVIENQFIGNPRTNSFRETDIETRSRLIKNY